MIGRHSYDNIAEYIDKVLNEFSIQNKTTLVVTDNASNFVKAFRYVYCYSLNFLHFKQSEYITHLGCNIKYIINS